MCAWPPARSRREMTYGRERLTLCCRHTSRARQKRACLAVTVNESSSRQERSQYELTPIRTLLLTRSVKPGLDADRVQINQLRIHLSS
jgi:hypothetical protein